MPVPPPLSPVKVMHGAAAEEAELGTGPTGMRLPPAIDELGTSASRSSCKTGEDHRALVGGAGRPPWPAGTGGLPSW